MPSLRIQKDNNSGIYFVTLTIKNWYYIFDRYNRWNLLAESLIYCMKNKRLSLYSYVFMLNHIHMIFSSPDCAGFLRDFKKYTTTTLLKNISQTEPMILKLFADEVGYKQVWEKTNLPLLIESENFLRQKMNYIVENPVRKMYVKRAEDWYWSSANPQAILPAQIIL